MARTYISVWLCERVAHRLLLQLVELAQIIEVRQFELLYLNLSLSSTTKLTLEAIFQKAESLYPV